MLAVSHVIGNTDITVATFFCGIGILPSQLGALSLGPDSNITLAQKCAESLAHDQLARVAFTRPGAWHPSSTMQVGHVSYQPH